MPILNMIAQGGSGGGGGNIGEPLNLSVISVGLDATITWEDNEIGTIPPTTFAKSELVRKIGSAPTSPSDGTLVVTETVKDTYKTIGYVDQGLTDGETYYYRVFSYSDLGGISYCDAVSVTPTQSGYDMSKWAFSQQKAINGDWSGGVNLKPDGSKIYWSVSSKIYESDLSTPFDISLTNLSTTKYISGISSDTDFRFSTDGTKLFACSGLVWNPNGMKIRVYDLGTAWDISSISSPTEYTLYGVPNNTRGMWFMPDGTKLYISGDTIVVYDLSTAWDLSTASSSTAVTTSTYGGLGLWFSNDGKFFCGQNGEGTTDLDYVYMSTGFDFSTITDSGAKNIGRNNASGIWFNDAGTICIMIGGGSNTNYITKYTL